MSGAREFYQDDGIDRVPAIQMLAVITRIDDSQLFAGWVETNVMYTFRGRRLDDETLPVTSITKDISTSKTATPTAVMTA